MVHVEWAIGVCVLVNILEQIFVQWLWEWHWHKELMHFVRCQTTCSVPISCQICSCVIFFLLDLQYHAKTLFTGLADSAHGRDSTDWAQNPNWHTNKHKVQQNWAIKGRAKTLCSTSQLIIIITMWHHNWVAYIHCSACSFHHLVWAHIWCSVFTVVYV